MIIVIKDIQVITKKKLSPSSPRMDGRKFDIEAQPITIVINLNELCVVSHKVTDALEGISQLNIIQPDNHAISYELFESAEIVDNLLAEFYPSFYTTPSVKPLSR